MRGRLDGLAASEGLRVPEAAVGPSWDPWRGAPTPLAALRRPSRCGELARTQSRCPRPGRQSQGAGLTRSGAAHSTGCCPGITAGAPASPLAVPRGARSLGPRLGWRGRRPTATRGSLPQCWCREPRRRPRTGAGSRMRAPGAAGSRARAAAAGGGRRAAGTRRTGARTAPSRAAAPTRRATRSGPGRQGTPGALSRTRTRGTRAGSLLMRAAASPARRRLRAMSAGGPPATGTHAPSAVVLVTRARGCCAAAPPAGARLRRRMWAAWPAHQCLGAGLGGGPAWPGRRPAGVRPRGGWQARAGGGAAREAGEARAARCRRRLAGQGAGVIGARAFPPHGATVLSWYGDSLAGSWSELTLPPLGTRPAGLLHLVSGVADMY